jgi:hypothetical protein
MLIAKFSRWDECSFNEYEASCLEYGYNCESSPDFISFMLRLNAPLQFFSYKRDGKRLGSVCVDNGWVVNDIKNKNKSIRCLPVPMYATYIPFSSEVEEKVFFPFKSKCLHPLQNKKFFNSSYNLLSKRTVAVVKNINADFSKKTVSTREREIRNFCHAGGVFKSVNQFNGDELFDVYNNLYRARRNIVMIEQAINRNFFNEFHSHFKGEIMFMDDEPIAMQLLLSVASKAGFFVDFINIGYKQNTPVNSIGTMLMWRNLTMLSAESNMNNQRLHYSYGAMSGEYKKRWCNPASVGKVLI